MGSLSGKSLTILALRCPALLLALVLVHGDCSNITQLVLGLISQAGLSNDAWPRILTDFPECFGILLCLALLLASEESLLHLYLVFLPVMTLILKNFVVTQRFLEMTAGTITACSAAESPAEPPTYSMWPQLVRYLLGVIRYFVGGENEATAGEVEEVSCESYYYVQMFFALLVTLQLTVSSVLVRYITVASNCTRMERFWLTSFVNVFLVPCWLRIAGSPAADVDFANRLVCRVVYWGMELWSSLSLERMLRGLRFIVHDAGVGAGWQLLDLWLRARRSLFVSWLIAYTAQCVNSLLEATNISSNELCYVQVMWSSVRDGSWSPFMYLGLCAAVSYLTDTVWRLVYLLAARRAPRHSVTDDGLSEAVTLVHARLVCYLINVSTAEMFSFVLPFLTSLLTIRWIYRSVKPLLLAADRWTQTSACVTYLAAIVFLPCLVVCCLSGRDGVANSRVYLLANLFVALRFSVRGASTLVQSFVKRRYATTTDVIGDAHDVNFVFRTVSSILRIILGACVVVYLFYIDALLIHVIIHQPRLAFRADFIGRCTCLVFQTYLQAWLLVIHPFRRAVDSLHKHYGAAGRVQTLPRLTADDRRLTDESCPVCLTSHDPATTRLTPCGHAFHARCLELSLRVSRDCPLCRHRILSNDAIAQ